MGKVKEEKGIQTFISYRDYIDSPSYQTYKKLTEEKEEPSIMKKEEKKSTKQKKKTNGRSVFVIITSLLFVIISIMGKYIVPFIGQYFPVVSENEIVAQVGIVLFGTNAVDAIMSIIPFAGIEWKVLLNAGCFAVAAVLTVLGFLGACFTCHRKTGKLMKTGYVLIALATLANGGVAYWLGYELSYGIIALFGLSFLTMIVVLTAKTKKKARK